LHVTVFLTAFFFTVAFFAIAFISNLRFFIFYHEGTKKHEDFLYVFSFVTLHVFVVKKS